MNVNGKIGQLLVKEGLARQEDIEAALEIQRKEAIAVLSQDVMETDWLDGTTPVESLPSVLPEFADETSAEKLQQVISEDKKVGRTIGQILCDLDLITPLDLSRVLKKYRKQLRLGEILLRRGIVDATVLEDALYEQQQHLQPVGDILVQNKQITIDQLYQALSEQYNIPYQKNVGCDYIENETQQLTEIVGFNYAEENLIVPLSLEGSKLTLALCFPEKISSMQELSAVYAYLRMDCVLVRPETFSQLFKQLYGTFPPGITAPESQDIGVATKPLLNIPPIAPPAIDTPKTDTKVVNASDIVNTIIKYAMVKDASSIHIEQDLQQSNVRFRISDVLQPLDLSWLKDAVSQQLDDVIAAIKEMAGLDLSESRLPQNGIFNLRYLNKELGQPEDFDIRVSTCPVISGENITLRISKTPKGPDQLDNLPHSSHVMSRFKKLLRAPAGILLISGPPGSGRCETLKVALSSVQTPGNKVITIEDSIRQSLPGIMQTQIHPERHLSYARLLRTVINQDADVIMVENMPNKETVIAALDLARAGHLVLGRLDAKDAVDAIIQLGLMEIPSPQIAQYLIGVVSQCRIRKLCRTCRQPYVPKPQEWEGFFDQYPARISFFREKGCKRCNDTGFDGHMYLSEVLEVTPKVTEALHQGIDETMLRHAALESGMKSILNDGLARLSLTSLDEMIRIFPRRKIGKATYGKPPAMDRKAFSLDKRHEWLVVSVIRDRHLIDEMWQQYLFFKAQNKEAVLSTEAALFRQYIEESFHHICQTDRCDCVTFRMEFDKGRIELSALPGRPS